MIVKIEFYELGAVCSHRKVFNSCGHMKFKDKKHCIRCDFDICPLLEKEDVPAMTGEECNNCGGPILKNNQSELCGPCYTYEKNANS